MMRYFIILCLMCIGCAPSANSSALKIVTAIPTIAHTSTPVPVNNPAPTSTQISSNCTTEHTSDELADYVPTNSPWITIVNNELKQNTIRYPIYGINYYPRLSPFARFLTDTDTEVMGKELDVITPSGINTLRIFVSLEQLFICEQEAIPNVETFTRLDSILQTIAEKNLHAIIVLHQTLDHLETPLWGQVQFLVRRYHNEPAILAWDVLDKGDQYYDEYTSEAVLTWLAEAILAIRQVDGKHLITSSWQSHATDTVEWVDLVSFQHFGDYLSLQQHIANLKARTNKPILLSTIGFSTFDMDETAQRNLLYQAMEETRNNNLAGWGIYMAFDYPTTATCIDPNCPAEASSINFYGIWNTSYFPKLAVDAVKRVTQTE